MLADGSPFQNVEVINNNSIIIRTDINHHRFQIFTGYHGQQTDQASNPPAPETDSGAFVAAAIEFATTMCPFTTLSLPQGA